MRTQYSLRPTTWCRQGRPPVGLAYPAAKITAALARFASITAALARFASTTAALARFASITALCVASVAHAQTAPAATPVSTPASVGAATTLPGTTPAPVNQGDGNANTVRLHDLERKVDELKEQIFRSKARLNLLKETVLHGVIAGARAVITHRNEMGVLYQPIRIVYALDGAEIFGKTDDSGKLGEQKEIEVFNGSILPGSHTLSVLIIYQGNGMGVFSYLKGYKFTVRASHSFTVPEGKISTIKVVGFEKGNAFTTDPKDRPALDFRSNVSTSDAKKAK